jgi:Heterokaryon incompatibility protein (HET)
LVVHSTSTRWPGDSSLHLTSSASPGNNGDDLEGTLETVDLNDPPHYEGLSWYWGDAALTCPLILNGEKVKIPYNLAEALREFRQSTVERKMWIDAVCINQADLVERASQILLMGDIYRSAAQTTVWLGPMTSPYDSITLNTLENLGSGKSYDHCVRLSRERYARDDSWVIEVPDLAVQLRRFFYLSWWTRLRVLQEVAVSSTSIFWWAADKSLFEYWNRLVIPS